MISKHDLSAFSFPLLRDSRTFKMTLQSQIWWWVLCGPGISKWLNAIFWWAGEPSFIFKELCNNFLHTKKVEDKLGCCCQLFKCGCVRKSACKKATECGSRTSRSSNNVWSKRLSLPWDLTRIFHPENYVKNSGRKNKRFWPRNEMPSVCGLVARMDFG